MRGTRILVLVLATLTVPMLGPATVPQASAQCYDTRCAVFRGDRLVESAPCYARGDKRSNKPNATIYRWRTGGTTRLSNIEEWFTINGSEGETVFTKDGYRLCVKNLSTGNTFCHN